MTHRARGHRRRTGAVRPVTLLQLAEAVVASYDRSPRENGADAGTPAPAGVYLAIALESRHDPRAGAYCRCASCAACRNHQHAQWHAAAGREDWARWHQGVGDAWFLLADGAARFRTSLGTT